MYMGCSYIYNKYHIGILKHKKHDFSVQVRNFLLPLSLKVFRHKEREAQSFYSGFFICTPFSCDTSPRPLRASESQPSSPEAVLISTNWLFQNLPKSSARFQCVTSFTLASPVSYLGLLWHLWVTRPLRPRTRVNTYVNVAPK